MLIITWLRCSLMASVVALLSGCWLTEGDTGTVDIDFSAFSCSTYSYTLNLLSFDGSYNFSYSEGNSFASPSSPDDLEIDGVPLDETIFASIDIQCDGVDSTNIGPSPFELTDSGQVITLFASPSLHALPSSSDHPETLIWANHDSHTNTWDHDQFK
jgi:hypothetical protein